MYFFLILFFISLCGIILMIGRKMMFVNFKEVTHLGKFKLEPISLNEIKIVTIKKAKKYGYIILIITLRASIKTSHFVKSNYGKAKTKIKSRINNSKLIHRNKEHKEKEVSHFLKMISDYKRRVKYIKHKIREEEGLE